MTTENERIEESVARKIHWTRWGPYLSERQWGTVREDYSPAGNAWEYLPHDHARSRAYRWGEDGIGGLCDRHQRVCFSVAMWNRRDPILKERLFGLGGDEGNHGEDVKECYFYLDATPTSSYLKMLYKYPQAEFPYNRLVQENARRGKNDPEFELLDTGIFDGDRYFDVLIEYAKAGAEDVLARITVTNAGKEPASLDLLPTIWFRNTWSWGRRPGRPKLWREPHAEGLQVLGLERSEYGRRYLLMEGKPELLFTENETNYQRLFNIDNSSPYVKDAFHEYLIAGKKDAVNPERWWAPRPPRSTAWIFPAVDRRPCVCVLLMPIRTALRQAPSASSLPILSPRALRKPTSFTLRIFVANPPTIPQMCNVKLLQACCGTSSPTTMT